MRTLELTDEEYASAEQMASELGVDVRQMVRAMLAAAGRPMVERASGADESLVQRIRERLVERGTITAEPIRQTEGTMGGVPCVRDTRIPIWLLVSFKRQGMSDSELLRAYPSLNASDLAAAWSYYAAYADSIEAQIREQDDEAVDVG